MSMFTLSICHLTTCNLSWFMSLPLQVLMQYRFYSIRLYFHYQSHPQLGIVFALALLFCFGSISSFFLELFLHWSPVAYWTPTDLGSSSFSVLSFCLFILFMGFSRQECWSGLPFHSPVATFCQTSPPGPVCFAWPYIAWLIVSLVRQGCGHCHQIG